MDVADWLRGLGLEQYVPTFRDNDIDGEVVSRLTAEDLRDLGIASIGHRRKLLDAIAVLGSASTGPQPQEAAELVGAERRHLTVLFCDLVGSTALASSLDPEDLREIIGAYHRRAADCIAALDGFVAKYMGDGVLAYFGYPQAHEDDAERAVRSALALTAAVGQIEAPAPLRVRIGIASGIVVVGDLVGTGEAQERGIVGETPNLAARLQGLAEPNAIVVADGTRREIGALFEVRDLGMRALAGFAEPQRAWQVSGEERALSRFEALRSGTTPLVGREEEAGLLLRRWAQAREGEGHAVLVVGEAGVGKSRLSAALQRRVRSETHLSLRYFCSPYHQGSALHPIIAQLERAAGFAPDDTPDRRLDRLEALLASGAPTQTDLALFAELLSLPGAARYGPLDLAPQRKKERTFDAWLRQLERRAADRPVLLAFEDLHWIDPTSGELLDLLIERIEGWPALLVATFRPEFQARWTGQPQVTTLALTRLNHRNAAELVARIAGPNNAVSDDLATEIVERCDGVPLFIEELTKAVIEQAGGQEQARAVVSAAGGGVSVPATLQASLMARLDRLGASAREAAQAGAAIGREFTLTLLEAAAAPRDADTLHDALARLVAAGLVFQRGIPPEATFLFKHALVQDAAYGTLLRGPRQALHDRIADALLAAEPAAAPEIVAHHLQNAGRETEAIGYWREAGERAVRRAAHREAIEHYRRALALIEKEPEASERWRTELAILSQLAPALMNVYGWSAEEVGEATERAAAVGRRLESSAALAPSIANLWLFNFSQARFDRADGISGDLFRIARDLDDPGILLQAYHCAWPTAWHRGQFALAGEQIETALGLYDEDRHAHHCDLYLGHDPAVCGLAINASIRDALGDPARVPHLEAEALALARRRQHAPSLATALWFVCEARVPRGDVEGTRQAASELLTLCDEQGLPHWRANALVALGWALARSGEPAEGIARLDEGLRTLDRMGIQFYVTRSIYQMAEGLLAVGRSEEGLARVTQALDRAAETGVTFYLARLHQVRAELLLHASADNAEAAEASLQRALAIARGQGAVGYELRAAICLARLWAERQRRSEAQAVLAPVYARFPKELDTPDLHRAKALLAALGAAT